MSVVLDWRSARPDPAHVASVSQGAMRYLGDGRFASSFNLTIPERDALHAAGVPVGLVWEREAKRMDEGGGTGERDARVANQQADDLGWPMDRPIYFACDDRTGGRVEHVAYVESARNISPRPVGVYGPGRLLDQVTVRYKWAVETWPGYAPPYQLVQMPNVPAPLPGTDYNDAYGDWGGWLPEGEGSGMPTGQDLLESARRFHGEPYSTAPGRTSQTSGYKDCSGLVYAALVGVGITPGGTVSTTIERWAVANGGRYLSKAEALAHPGCGLTIGGAADGWTGAGPRGHIALGVGDGEREYGTPSDEGRRVGYSRFSATRSRNRYTGFFTIPGIDHLGTHDEEDDVKGVFVKDKQTGWTYILSMATLTPVRSREVGQIAMATGQVSNSIDSPLEYEHSQIVQFNLYADHLPRGWPSADTADWVS